jgi:hypothetical protein
MKQTLDDMDFYNIMIFICTNKLEKGSCLKDHDQIPELNSKTVPD